jgi:hypothetical protein
LDCGIVERGKCGGVINCCALHLHEYVRGFLWLSVNTTACTRHVFPPVAQVPLLGHAHTSESLCHGAWRVTVEVHVKDSGIRAPRSSRGCHSGIVKIWMCDICNM